jgi:colicin import membrane protein
MPSRSPTTPRRIRQFALCAVLALPFVSSADEGREADWRERQQRADALRSEARERQNAAARRLEEANAECADKFLVNACRATAQDEYLGEVREARRIDAEGRAMQRAVVSERLAERDREIAARPVPDDAELASRAAANSARRAADEARIAAQKARKERQAEAGARRKAAEAEKLRRKQAEAAARRTRRQLVQP